MRRNPFSPARTVFVCFALCAASFVCPAAPANDEHVIRIGISTFTETNPNRPIIEKTLAELKRSLGEDRVTVEQHTLPELERAVREKRLDFFLSSSGFYRRMMNYGVKDLATLVSPPFFDPNRQEASAVIVRADRTEYRTLKDLKRASLAANMPESFSGYQIGLGEFAPFASPPERYFSNLIFVGRDMGEVIRRVTAGTADAGILRRCYLEEYARAHPEFSPASVRVLNEQAAVPCRYSTKLYPNWSFSATGRTDFQKTREVLSVVLGMKPAENGLYWSVANDFSGVDKLMKDLRIGPYEFLRNRGLRDLWDEYWKYALGVIALLFGLAAHSLATERTVRRRTEELETALSEQKRLREESERAHQQLYQLQKLGAVGAISTLIVHELSQPLAALRLYVGSLSRLVRRPGEVRKDRIAEALGPMKEETERIESIVSRMRSYVKGRKAEFETVELARPVGRAVELVRQGRCAAAEVTCSGDETLKARGDEMDLELAVVNLVKNACEASLKSPRPKVAVRLSKKPEEKAVSVAVTDSGPRLTDEEYSRLSEIFQSDKADGLGLGLAIVRSIAERHGGRLEFRRNAGDGLTAELTLPEA